MTVYILYNLLTIHGIVFYLRRE